MNSVNHIAFKEWAVVCAALASGQQSLILRKGGIHEGREGFRVAHREFWLFPTGFHQEPDAVIPATRPLLDQVLLQQPPAEEVHIRHYVEVEQVVEIHDMERLSRLSPWHIWSEKTMVNRFHYKLPGLFAMLVRVSELPQPFHIPVSPHFAGCRSWVDLPNEIATSGLKPVVTETVHADRMHQIRELLRVD